MNPRFALALSFLALLGGTAAAAPTAKVMKKKQIQPVGKVTLKRGTAKMAPTTEVHESARVELERDGPLLDNPDNRGVFAGKLPRGVKAKLTAKDPAAHGIALITVQGAASFPLYIGMREPGIHFTGPGGETSWRAREGAALAMSPAKLAGDDVRVACHGDFAGEMDVAVLHIAQTQETAAEHSLDATSGKIEFVVDTTGMDDGLIVMILTSPKGANRLTRCTVSRETPA